MFGLGVGELVFILLLLIFFYGAKRLPQIGEGLGRSIRGFKEGYHAYDAQSEPPSLYKPEEQSLKRLPLSDVSSEQGNPKL